MVQLKTWGSLLRAMPQVMAPLDQRSNSRRPSFEIRPNLCENWENVIKFRLLTDWTAAGVYVHPH